MLCITRIDLLIIIVMVFVGLNLIAILYHEDIGILTVIIGGVVTVTGYAFIRPPNGDIPCIGVIR